MNFLRYFFEIGVRGNSKNIVFLHRKLFIIQAIEDIIFRKIQMVFAFSI
jgi:hypothetical protein